MNQKELNEIRRHLSLKRCGIHKIYGCFVSSGKEIISDFQTSFGLMSEFEAEKYLSLLKKTLSGTLGKIPENRSARIAALRLSGGMRRRLRELGFIVGTRIICLHRVSDGASAAYLVRGTVIALRRNDAERIEVLP